MKRTKMSIDATETNGGSARQLQKLVEVLRMPSISTDPTHSEEVAACAEWVASLTSEIGLQTTVYSTSGHPIVVARNTPRPDRRTVLIYGHYDVQPVDPIDLWTSPPFEPRIEGNLIYARGSSDNKGQFMAHILGIEETLSEKGELPVNVIVLIEGEEEIGSPNLEEFVSQHRDELCCDVVAISDSNMIASGVPTFTYGLRGIAAMEIRVRGPVTDLHSGIFGGAVTNPATELVKLVASLHDEDGRVAVSGFYDDVVSLATWEREGWTKLPMGDAALLKLTGVPALGGESGFSALERAWARPTAEINGIGGGFQGVGSKTVIPREAFVKLTFRLVPNQRPDDVLAKVKAHFWGRVPKSVQVEIISGHSGDPYLTDPYSTNGKAAQRALGRTFGREVALIREGGSIPIVNTFRRILDADTLLLGLALPDCHAHAPNESFALENFYKGIRLNRTLLDELAIR